MGRVSLQVSRSHAEFDAALFKPPRQTKGRARFQVPPDDPAYLWSQCLAPAYGVNILASRAALSFKVRERVPGAGIQ